MKELGMRFLVALGVLATTLLAGCAGGGGGGGSTNLPDPEVRFINGSPNNTGIDFLLNEVVKASNVAFGSASPNFQSIDFISAQDDGYDISVRPNGGEELDRFGQVFNRDTDTLIVTLGLHDAGTEFDKRLQIFTYPISRTAPTGTRARVYVINGFIRADGFNTPNVSFQSVDAGDPPPFNNPSVETTDMTFGAIRNLLVDATSFQFIVRRADTDALVQYASANVSLLPGHIYAAIITGHEGEVDLNLQPKIVFIELATQ